jgi:signal transduction histidine kinase
LSIARHLVELHGGTIRARSGGEGCGTAFLVDLPASVPAAQGMADAPSSDGERLRVNGS